MRQKFNMKKMKFLKKTLTELEFVEISERPIEDDIATAVDCYIERPPTPINVEEEPGKDAATQVGEFDLFNFDQEVRPMVIVIVQHTLLRALAEIHQEEEIINIAKHKDEYEVQRNVRLAELQRFEAKAQRLKEEIARREEQRKNAKNEVRKLNREVAENGYSDFYATDIVLLAMDLLETDGFFYDEIEAEVRNSFLPWLTTELTQAMTVRQQLNAFHQKVEEKVSELSVEAKKKFGESHSQRIQEEDETQKHAFRDLLIEDQAGEKIRRALEAYKKQKDDQELKKKGNEDGDEDESNQYASESN